jgi:hypothetical protein
VLPRQQQVLLLPPAVPQQLLLRRSWHLPKQMLLGVLPEPSVEIIAVWPEAMPAYEFCLFFIEKTLVGISRPRASGVV